MERTLVALWFADIAGYCAHAAKDESSALRLVPTRVVPAPELDLRTDERRSVSGPALLELPGATCWVPEGWSGETDEHGTLVLAR